jgi:hypothetical protein
VVNHAPRSSFVLPRVLPYLCDGRFTVNAENLPPVHPAAEWFPLMNEASLQALADDLKQNGQRDRCLLLDGKLLDGRNRFLACAMVGIKRLSTSKRPMNSGTSGSRKESLIPGLTLVSCGQASSGAIEQTTKTSTEMTRVMGVFPLNARILTVE